MLEQQAYYTLASSQCFIFIGL